MLIYASEYYEHVNHNKAHNVQRYSEAGRWKASVEWEQSNGNGATADVMLRVAVVGTATETNVPSQQHVEC